MNKGMRVVYLTIILGGIILILITAIFVLHIPVMKAISSILLQAMLIILVLINKRFFVLWVSLDAFALMTISNITFFPSIQVAIIANVITSTLIGGILGIVMRLLRFPPDRFKERK
jgi:hypothetical protein